MKKMKKLVAILLSMIMLMAMIPLSFNALAAEVEMLDEVIIKFFPREMFPGKEKQYDDEVAKVLKDGLTFVAEDVYVVKAEGLSRNPNALLNRFKNSKFIEYVEPNYVGTFENIPNDPNYRSQSITLTALNAQAGWEIITGGGPIVAIIDSGIIERRCGDKYDTGDGIDIAVHKLRKFITDYDADWRRGAAERFEGVFARKRKRRRRRRT